MRTIKAVPLTVENFRPYGSFTNALNPSGNCFAGEESSFYLNFFWFNTPQLAAENWGCGGFVPPHTQRFQGEILNTPELAPGILYPDPVTLPVSGIYQIAFSPLTVKKQKKFIITMSEYHDHTGEGICFLDDAAVMHVAPPSKREIAPQKTEAFIVPKGTVVKLNTGVWHLSPQPLHVDVLHLLIMMPERVYANDCVVCQFPESEYIEVLY